MNRLANRAVCFIAERESQILAVVIGTAVMAFGVVPAVNFIAERRAIALRAPSLVELRSEPASRLGQSATINYRKGER